jgi:TrwC relaxase/AAA domain
MPQGHSEPGASTAETQEERSEQGAGAIADRVLEVELTRRLGLTWQMRPDGIAREIDGVDQAAMDLFSSRSRTLTKRAEQLVAEAEERRGRPLNSLERDRIRRQASMATRRAKTHEGESREELLDRWDAELRSDVAGGLHRIADRFADAGTAEAAAAEWTPSAVIAQAIEACHTGTSGDGRATFGRSELIRQIMLALPDELGDLTGQDVVQLAERLADEALSGNGVVQTSGQELGSEPAASRLADGRAATIAPGSQRWAGTGHVEAEIALLRSAGTRGAARLDRAAVEAWLDGPGADLSPAQREAVAGLATSDAALTVLIGPAGTGKSFTAGALAALWALQSLA